MRVECAEYGTDELSAIEMASVIEMTRSTDARTRSVGRIGLARLGLRCGRMELVRTMTRVTKDDPGYWAGWYWLGVYTCAYEDGGYATLCKGLAMAKESGVRDGWVWRRAADAYGHRDDYDPRVLVAMVLDGLRAEQGALADGWMWLGACMSRDMRVEVMDGRVMTRKSVLAEGVRMHASTGVGASVWLSNLVARGRIRAAPDVLYTACGHARTMQQWDMCWDVWGDPAVDSLVVDADPAWHRRRRLPGYGWMSACVGATTDALFGALFLGLGRLQETGVLDERFDAMMWEEMLEECWMLKDGIALCRVG